MQVAAGTRPDRSVPIYAVAVSAALLVVVALLIALQPPSGSSVAGGPVLSWMRALLFAGGLAFFALGMAGFARSPSNARAGGVQEQTPASVRSGDDDVQGYGASVAARDAIATQQAADTSAATPSRHSIAPATSYTAISFSRTTGEPVAIADFDDPDELAAALAAWGWQHPDENFHVFNERGVEVARVPAAEDQSARSERRSASGGDVPAAFTGRFVRVPA